MSPAISAVTQASQFRTQAGQEYPRFRWLILASVTLNYAALGVILIAFAPVLGVLAKEFGVTVGQTSLAVMATYTFAAALSTIASGPLVDRFGAPRCILAGSVVAIVSTLLAPVLGQTLMGVAAVRILMGLSAGPVSACTSSVAARWFPPQERGIFTGAQGAGIAVGIAVGLVAMPAALQASGRWRTAVAWMVIAPVVGLIFSIIALQKKEPAAGAATGPAEAVAGSSGDFKRALRQSSFYIATFSMFAFTWIMNAFNDLTPAYIAIAAPLGLGLGPMTAGKNMMAVQVGMIVGPVAGGLLLEKVFQGRARPVLLIAFLFAGLFMLSIKFPFVYGNPATMLICLFLAGFFEAFVIPAVSASIARHYPPQIVGKVFALAFGICIFGGSVGVGVGGTILHYTNSFRGPILIVALVALAGAVVSAFFRPPHVFTNINTAIQ